MSVHVADEGVVLVGYEVELFLELGELVSEGFLRGEELG